MGVVRWEGLMMVGLGRGRRVKMCGVRWEGLVMVGLGGRA